MDSVSLYSPPGNALPYFQIPPLEHKSRTHVSLSFHASSFFHVIYLAFYFGLVRVLSLRYCWGDMPSICLNTFENRLELSKPTLEAISVRFELP